MSVSAQKKALSPELSSDRRAQPRRSVFLRAQVELSSELIPILIKDLSTRGAFIGGAANDISVGCRIKVRVRRPGAKAINTFGTVRWVGHSPEHGCEGFGIEFDSSLEDLEAEARGRPRLKNLRIRPLRP